jgi:hypothetical protein
MYHVPCETCGSLTTYKKRKKCINCWEVERRLSDYVENSKGREFVRSFLPCLDDWVDGQPDAWDFEAVLKEHKVQVTYDAEYEDWALTWEQGTMCIGLSHGEEELARRAAALFIELWNRGVSASFADKLMNGYIMWERR